VTISYRLTVASDVRLAIYDVAGRLVRQVERGVREAGSRSVTWDGTDGNGRRAGAGMYFARLSIGTTHAVARPFVRL
jgi:flagellar hook assembly protein FlgD